MGRPTFPVQASILSSDTLVNWLKTKYRLRQPVACVFQHKGINDTYKVKRRLSRKELQAIPIFGAMRQIWLMGTHASISKRWGIGWLNDRYFDRSIKFVRDWVKEYGILE